MGSDGANTVSSRDVCVFNLVWCGVELQAKPTSGGDGPMILRLTDQCWVRSFLE